jgi:hypothetical protein
MTAMSVQKRLLGVALVASLLLLVPAAAMQFSSEVAWGPGDFLVAWVLLFGAGAAAVLGFSHVHGTRSRAILVLVIASGLAVVWAELAVGLFN